MTNTENHSEEDHAESVEDEPEGTRNSNSEIAATEEADDLDNPSSEDPGSVENLSSNDKEKIMARMEHFSGPFPHPQHLKEYAEVYPEAPKIIFSMAEQQQQQRHDMQQKEIKKYYFNQNLGMILGFILALIFLLGGFYLISIGKNTMGIATIIVSLISLFVERASKQKETSKDAGNKKDNTDDESA